MQLQYQKDHLCSQRIGWVFCWNIYLALHTLSANLSLSIYNSQSVRDEAAAEFDYFVPALKYWYVVRYTVSLCVYNITVSALVHESFLRSLPHCSRNFLRESLTKLRTVLYTALGPRFTHLFFTRQYAPLKLRSNSARIHGPICQKAVILIMRRLTDTCLNVPILVKIGPK